MPVLNAASGIAKRQPSRIATATTNTFEHINDTYGHPVGDEALAQLSKLLASIGDGAAFRFGGDEFAVLVATDELNAYREVERIQRELSTYPVSPEGPIAISVGIATFPTHAADAPDLQRTADGALYWSKAHGKRRSRSIDGNAFRGRLGPRGGDRHRARSRSRSDRSSAAGRPPARHRQDRAARLDPARTRPLTDDEYAMVQRHPEFGHELLDGIGIDPVDDWVLHHHEHWNGSGYPHGLAGEDIPLGSRIILVADAFEAMTADRPYRQAPGRDYALRELRANAGTQFDPVVVAALERHLAGSREERVEALA